MRMYRDVDATQKWMNTAVSEDMLVPAMAQAVIGEIEAQATHIATLENTISTREETIRGLKGIIGDHVQTIEEQGGKIERMREVIEELGIKAKVLRLLKEEF